MNKSGISRKAVAKTGIWMLGFLGLFLALWGFFSIGGGGLYWEINGHAVEASPAIQGAVAAMVFPLLLLATVAIFFVIFSFTWLSLGLMFLATAFITGLIFLPLLTPVLLPLAFFLLLLAIFSRTEKPE